MSNNLLSKQRGGLALPSNKSLVHTYIGAHAAAVAGVILAIPLALGSSALTSRFFKSNTEASVATVMSKTTRVSKPDMNLQELKIGLISAYGSATNTDGTCDLKLEGVHIFGRVIKATGTSTCLESDGRYLKIKNHFVVADVMGGSFEYLPANEDIKPSEPSPDAPPKMTAEEDLPIARATMTPSAQR